MVEDDARGCLQQQHHCWRICRACDESPFACRIIPLNQKAADNMRSDTLSAPPYSFSVRTTAYLMASAQAISARAAFKRGRLRWGQGASGGSGTSDLCSTCTSSSEARFDSPALAALCRNRRWRRDAMRFKSRPRLNQNNNLRNDFRATIITRTRLCLSQVAAQGRPHVAVAIHIQLAPLRRLRCIVAKQQLQLQVGVNVTIIRCTKGRGQFQQESITRKSQLHCHAPPAPPCPSSPSAQAWSSAARTCII
jgi:hypothetical protein